jgi:hypothetical protein
MDRLEVWRSEKPRRTELLNGNEYKSRICDIGLAPLKRPILLGCPSRATARLKRIHQFSLPRDSLKINQRKVIIDAVTVKKKEVKRIKSKRNNHNHRTGSRKSLCVKANVKGISKAVILAFEEVDARVHQNGTIPRSGRGQLRHYRIDSSWTRARTRSFIFLGSLFCVVIPEGMRSTTARR